VGVLPNIVENLFRAGEGRFGPAPEPRSEEKKDYRARYEELTGKSLRASPICDKGKMFVVEVLAQRRRSPRSVGTATARHGYLMKVTYAPPAAVPMS
jgi:hypothetical protein